MKMQTGGKMLKENKEHANSSSKSSMEKEKVFILNYIKRENSSSS